ncbi:TIM-barrel domain-containing protein [Methylacidimicrobium sp. B4]|uniref:TIM-barrel domain-containing protein n=1 Tax=Methylacidimicrobium sp. B4 TaxID=2796139 RepID=UPI001A8BF8C0|nr:TIM-barrel domain-containing protein [Methylacidimicrobium sp. B4]QSR85253.1 DUF4968 domain-containing protein [Methylacidimicrobium sp. B4]
MDAQTNLAYPADIDYTPVNDFTPNRGDWTSAGPVQNVTRNGDTFTLELAGGRRILLSFLSTTSFRLRFHPDPTATYGPQGSPAVVNLNLGPVSLTVTEDSPARLVVDTGSMRVQIDRQPYRLQVFRGAQLIAADPPTYNLVYIPGHFVIANFRQRPETALYFGLGEKAGAQLNKSLFTLTQFNFDNYTYSVGVTVPSGPGPLNPSEPLYVSIPFLLEVNPSPNKEFAGAPYAYGLFLDNSSQSYFNLGSNDYSNMDGKIYYGALFGELDTYFLLGDHAQDVLAQYTTLTGRSPMPPRYALGFHQGAYGYYDHNRLQAAADAYRQSGIPCDGLHIDVDFQDNYRTFTHSEIKFPNAPALLAKLHAQGFKCSTNITPFLTDNALDENGKTMVYAQRQAILNMGGLIYGTYVGQGPSRSLFIGGVNYGVNFNRFNPYQYPPLTPNQYGNMPLSSSGNYPDLGRADVRQVWGQQYAHLIREVGIDMIWQDMMCPALDSTKFAYNTFPLTLMVNDGVGYAPNGACHNAYALFLAQATWEGLRALRPDRRNFMIARGGFAGIQRYCALWTGDSASSWDFLAVNLPEVLNLGLSGVPISGCDIGGFAKGSASVGESSYGPGFVHGGVTNYELLTRWMHLGAFLPWYRNHYDGYNKQFQEPYNYGEPVPTHCRKYVELRYRMLQIHYDALYEWTQTGMPPARALFLNDPSDPEVYHHLGDQFFVGRDFLVAPILFPAQQQNPPVATRSVYLPNTAAWYAFKDNTAPLDAAVPAGTHIPDWVAGLDQVPIYIRAGAILPMLSLVEQYVGQLPQNPLEITVYPGPDRDYLMYLDDGFTTRAESNGEYRTTRISQRSQGGVRTIVVQRLIDAYTPAEPYLLVRVLYDPTTASLPASVTVNGGTLPQLTSVDQLANQPGDAFAQDPGTRSLVVKVMDDRASVTIAVGPHGSRDDWRGD